MGKRKKPFISRLASLFLFLLITWLVFNFGSIVKKAMIVTGISDLDWVEIERIDIKKDKVLDNNAYVFAHSNNLIVNYDNKISIYTGDGEFIGTKEVNSNAALIVGLDDYFIVADQQQGHLFVLDYLGNIVGEASNLGQLKDVVGITNNTFVVLTEANALQVFNHECVMFSDITIPSGDLLGIDVAKDDETILVNILNSDDENYTSQLVLYSMEENIMSGAHNTVDVVVYGAKLYHEDVIIVDMNGQHAYRIGDTEHYIWDVTRNGSLISFEIDNNGNIYEITKLQEIQDIIGQSEYHLVCVNKDGKLIFEKTLDVPYNDISLYEGSVLLQSDREFVIYDSAGEIIKHFESDKKIVAVEWLSKNRLVVEYNDYIDILSLSY